MTPSSWQKTDLKGLPARGRFLAPGDPGWEAYRGDIVLDGCPDAVVRPRDEDEVREILAFANAHAIPVTFAGGQTSLTGSSVAEEGILLATENLGGLRDLRPDPETGRMTAVAGPGVFLGEFQRELESRGWSYPPDPTSRNEARLGATVATNATGEDTLFYGPTRRWIRALRIVCADGSVRTFRRPAASIPAEEKATAGYYSGKDPIDLFIGSEGTLGAITGITVDLTRRHREVLCGLAFFPTLRAALEFTVAARSARTVTPRALELLDRAALDMVGPNPEGVTWPEATGAAIYFKQEYRDEADRDRLLAAWFDLVGESLTPGDPGDLLDAVLVVDDPAGRTRLRSFRHRVPATLHEIVRGYREAGGGKVGTDWWVPYRALPRFLDAWQRRLRDKGLECVMFGHVGNGHPHVNFLPPDGETMARARAAVVTMCREAVALGGGVAGEHGLGKLKRELLAVQYPEGIEAMRAVKNRWDPKWILGRGNLILPA